MQLINPERRIKRHVIGRRQDFFAVTLPGFESTCAQELNNLMDMFGTDTLEVKEVIKGGVTFKGRLTDLYLANLHVRTAIRILMRLNRFKATNFKQLETHTGKIPWELYLSPGAVPALSVTSHHCRLYHTSAVSERIEKRISAYWSDQGVGSKRSKVQTLFVRLQDDRATFSLDSSGKPLYRRGLKTHAAQAPLRESTAAAILTMAGYRPDRVLVDPMCGSGTFSLEAALMVKHVAPGLRREFAFMDWPAYRPKQWAHNLQIAEQRRRTVAAPLIWASDSDETAVSRLQACVEQNGFEDAVAVAHQDFFSLQPQRIARHPGLIVLNPPYGRRLQQQGNTEKRYQDIAAKLKMDFRGWNAALVVPSAGLAKGLGLSLKPFPLDHGGLRLTLLYGRIGAT